MMLNPIKTPLGRILILAALLAAGLGWSLSSGCGPGRDLSRPSVLVILIDTLRADRLGCYGYERPTSPNIDRFAAGATLCEKVTAPCSWTLPSIASLFTGLYPTRHQAINVEAPLPEWRETLAEILKANGYKTGGVISNTLVSSRYHMNQGFDDFDESQMGGYLDVSSEEVSDLAVEWLKENHRSPFLLFLHYYDPHNAYIPHEGYEFGRPYDGWIDYKMRLEDLRRRLWRVKPEDAAYLADLYDSEIAFTDHHVGRVLDQLRKLKLDRSTLVLITSDHGEGFMEHGWLGHTRDLYEEIIHVPLILRCPTVPDLPARFGDPVELIDVMPTLLEFLNIERDLSGIDGRSFAPSLLGQAPVDSLIFSEMNMMPVTLLDEARTLTFDTGMQRHDIRAHIRGRYKVIHETAGGRWEFYNLEEDPGEKSNLAEDESHPAFGPMRQRLLDWIAETEEIARRENMGADSAGVDTANLLDEETEEQLRSLGYIQ